MSANVASIKKQHGYSMVLFFLVIFLGSVAVILPNINHDKIRLRNDQINNENLQKAKEALLNFAATSFRNNGATFSRYGVLPCPDVTAQSVAQAATLPNPLNIEGVTDGNCGAHNNNAIGRLPWRSLGLRDSRDLNNECLWYAVSGTYKSTAFPAPVLPQNYFINSDTPGTLQITDELGNNPIDDVVAVILAPGSARVGQNRTALANGVNVCGGNYTAANYLDSANGLNNADVTPVVAPALGAVDNFYINSTLNSPTPNLALGNDQLIYITRQELWAHLAKNNQLTLDIANRILFGQAEQAPAAGPLPANQNGLWACIKSFIEGQAPTINGVANRRFPLPTAINLPDYTSNNNYQPSPIAPPQPLLNRLPDFNIISPNCQVIPPLPALPIWGDSESINLYNNWKDHLFIGLSTAANPATNDFLCVAGAPPPAGCILSAVDGNNYDVPDCNALGSCITVNTTAGGTTQNIFAVIIFAGFSQNLIRNGNNALWPFLDPESKNTLANYLEGINNPDATGDPLGTTDGIYPLQQTVSAAPPRTPPLNSSDILYCIRINPNNHQLNIVLCP